MAARHKNFGSPVTVTNSDEPITFQVYGRVFRCVPALQGRTMLYFMSMSSSDDGAESARAIEEFFKTVIYPADQEAWDKLSTSNDLEASTIIDMKALSEIMEWLVEQYSERPTKPSPPSAPGEVITGPGPTAVPSFSPVPA